MLLPQAQKSLTHKTLLKMSFRIAIVVILITLISYLHLVSVLKSQTLEQIEKYILERGQRESSIFTLAQDNHLILKQELYRRLEILSHQELQTQFEQLFVKWSDGTIRNRPKDQSPKDFDTSQSPSVFIGQQVNITPEIQRRVVTFYQLLSQYGPAWRNRFVDTYILAPENIVLNYWPGEPWALNAKADLNIQNEEYFYVSDQQHNPERKPAWTRLYFDHVVKLWMVSVETPVDDAQGRHIATIGNDIILNELMERTIHNTLEGTYNLILREDGHLIAAPHKMKELQEQGGKFNITQSGDRHLLRVFELIKNRQPNQVILENTLDHEYLAVTKIDGPGWYFITVYPKSLLTALAFKTASFILVLGIISLLIEIIILFWVLRTQVAKPLHEFIFATQQIARCNWKHGVQTNEPGHFIPHPLPVKRCDELGQLANSFNQMAEQLKTSFDTLETKNAEFKEVMEDIIQVSQELARGNLCVTLQAEYHGELFPLKQALETGLANLRSVTKDIIQVSQGLANGNLHIVPSAEYPGNFLQIKTALEIALSNIQQVIQDIINVSQGLAEGNLCVVPKSEYQGDLIQIKHALEAVLFNQRLVIEDIVEVSQELAEGNLNVTPKSEYLGEFIRIKTSLEKAATKLAAATQQNALQDWLKTGQNQLNEQMSGEQNIAGLTHNLVSFLTLYLEAQVGLCYLQEESFHHNIKRRLSLNASYAQTRRKSLADEFKFSEGLVERATREQKDFIITIDAGLEDTLPQHLAVVPFLYENAVKGVILLGSVKPLTEIQLDFLHQVMPSIGIAVNSIESRTKMHDLLQQTQIQAQELQNQQDTLQKNNEELTTQSEELQSQAEELQSQAEELRQTNEELEERSQELERQQHEIKDNNLALEKARQVMETKATELELANQYKSEFFANMSHELRTPLNSLLILAQLLADNKLGNLTDKQVEYAQTIQSAGSDLLLIINDILDLSKVEAGKMELHLEEIWVVNLIETIEHQFRPVAEEKGLAFQINVANNLSPTLRTDEKRLQQIINNLLSNALKFTSQGEIRLDIFYSIEPFANLAMETTKIIALSVTDTGIGIPEDKQQVIFEAFRQEDGTTNRRYGGTGLGLSISRQLSQLLGGQLHLQSEMDKGSTFTLYLPENLSIPANPAKTSISQTTTVESVAFNPTQVKPFVEQTSLGVKALSENVSEIKLNDEMIDDRTLLTPLDKTILIIEDDLQFANILMALAQERDFKCLIAEDGKTGLQVAQQYLPDAIILDIGLPQMDGWTVMDRLKESPDTRHIPVHFISAATEPEITAEKMGAIGYLQKPINMVQLRNALKKIERFVTKAIKSLLIIVDNETHQHDIMAIVSGRNIETIVAMTMDASLQYLRTAQFDCIILDIDVEQGAGIKLLEKMKEEQGLCQTPVIICANRQLSPTEEILLGQCADQLTVKSVNSPDRLLDETTLFLHQLEANLPKEECNVIRMVHDKEAILHRKKVLIADDDMRNTFALATVLEDKQMEVFVARNGKEVLAQLNEQEDIDIVLIDIMMPEMDGYEAIQEIRKQIRYRNLPIIALTAKAMKSDKTKCIEAGANEYLAKPIDTEKLISIMRVWLYR